MSWNNVIPFWILQVEKEEHQAKMQCAFMNEIDSGWLYSTPSHISTPIPVYEFTQEELDEINQRSRKFSEENALRNLGEVW